MGVNENKDYTERPLTDLERDELRSRFQSMRMEEMIFLSELLPVELCIRRLESFVSRANYMERILKDLLERESDTKS